MCLLVCPAHPKYKGTFPPRKTKINPDGCTKCWKIYEQKVTGEALEEEDWEEDSEVHRNSAAQEEEISEVLRDLGVRNPKDLD
jgi:hypothetical protein